VYGADKVWDQLNRDGILVARCTVERLMRDMDIQGARRGRSWVRTTTDDKRLERPADLVERRFRAPAPWTGTSAVALPSREGDGPPVRHRLDDNASAG
jgi:transposase InsO family protein